MNIYTKHLKNFTLVAIAGVLIGGCGIKPTKGTSSGGTVPTQSSSSATAQTQTSSTSNNLPNTANSNINTNSNSQNNAASPVYAYPSRSMEEYRNRVGKRIMDSNPQRTFLGKPPSPLASVPVMSITLNGDGSVKTIEIQRVPKFYPEMTEVARAAILRAAPYERIGHLPQPWTFSETFLFNDDLKFQLHSQQP